MRATTLHHHSCRRCCSLLSSIAHLTQGIEGDLEHAFLLPGLVRVAIDESLSLFPRVNGELSAQGGDVFGIACATRQQLEGQYALYTRDVEL
jgi:hypothetical protein